MKTVVAFSLSYSYARKNALRRISNDVENRIVLRDNFAPLPEGSGIAACLAKRTTTKTNSNRTRT